MRIDVHAHYIPSSIPELANRRGGFGPAANMRDSMSDLDQRLADMDERGIDIELVSAPPYVQNSEPDLCRRMNDATAAAIAGSQRFIGLATLPMQEPEAAAAELERCVRELGFRGLEILTNVHGENLHAPRFAPLYRKMQELDVAAFVHPQNVLGADRLGQFFMGNIIGNPSDTAVAAGCLIFGGVLEEMPGLRFVLAHGGGTCPRPSSTTSWRRSPPTRRPWRRWEHAWRQHLVEDTVIKRPPSEYFKKLYFDTLTHSAPVLNYLVETVGHDRIMLGSDYPFGMGDYTPPVSVQAIPHLTDAQRDYVIVEHGALVGIVSLSMPLPAPRRRLAIYSENAIRVFGLDL